MEFFKRNFILIFTNLFMIIYIIAVSTWGDGGWLFGKNVNWACVILTMYIFEQLSTLTFQLRIKLSAKFEDNPKLNSKLKYTVPIVGATSWLIAGVQSIILVAGTDSIWVFLAKVPPVFIATFNGIYINMKGKYELSK